MKIKSQAGLKNSLNNNQQQEQKKEQSDDFALFLAKKIKEIL